MNKKLIPDLLAILVLAVLLLAFFWPVVFGGETFVTTGVVFSDLMNQNYPFKVAYAQTLKQGQLPFWVAKMGDGFPLLAEGQVGAFYPLNLLFFYLLPPLLAFNFSLVLHYFLAGIFVYLLARDWLKLTAWPALLAGLTFSLSGFMMIHLVHLSLIQTVAWLPLQLWLLEKILVKTKLWQALPLGLIFANQFLAGHPELFYFSALFLGVYLVSRLFFTQEKGPKKLTKVFIILLIGGGLTAVLSAGQLVESWQMIGTSNRAQGFSFEEATSYLFPLRHFLTLVAPWVFDFIKEGVPPVGSTDMTNLWETYLYLGLIPLVLAGWAIATQAVKDKKGWFLLGGLIISLLLAFGRGTPLFRLFWNLVPGIKLFKYPTRFLVFTAFSMALLAGWGMAIVTQKIKDKKIQKWLIIVLVGLVFLDLFLIQRRINPTLKADDWFEPPATVQFLEKNLDQNRFYTLGTSNIQYESIKDLKAQKGLRELLPGDFNLIYGLASTNDQAAFFLDRHTQLTKGVTAARLKFDSSGSFTVPEALIKTLSLRSVKYVLSPLPLVNEDLILVKEIGLTKEVNYKVPQMVAGQIETTMVPTSTVYLYENLQVLSRARMVYQVKECLGCSDSQLLETLVSEDFDEVNHVLLEETGENKVDVQGKGEVEWLEDQDLKVSLRVKTRSGGYLVLADNHYPAWQALVDSQETKIYQANFAFRAVFIPDGEHEVEFKYEKF